tara:strand:- start:627 stop:1079 length:453 start_codon:yes stop_codon:yes gene_type:complete
MTTDLKTLFPGRKVSIEAGGQNISFHVRPMAVSHFRRFKDAVSKALEKIGGTTLDSGSLMVTIIDLVADDLMDVINECVDGIDLTDDHCPVWLFPQLATEWFEESFGDEGKVKPWVELIEKVVERFSGTKVNLWESLTASSPELDGPSEK